MKKLFTLSITILFCIVAVSQSKYNFSFEETEYSFLETKAGYQILCKSLDYFFLSDTTSPALPYKSIYVLIPENVDIENISIEVESKEILKDVHLVNNLVEQPVSVSKTINNSNIVSYKEKKYPSKNLQLETIMKMQDYYIAAFSACPFIYDTQNRSLNLITEMNLSFDLNESITTKSTSLSEKRYDMESVVKSIVVNPNEVNTLYSQTEKTSIKSTTSDSDIDYLIITDESLMDFFVPLKAWKIRKGINTVILSTNYIYSNYTGTTNQLKIKNCLQDYYANKNLKWALLGGDNTIVPVQGCYGQYSTYIDYAIPCDLFYSCFDNAFDWDANSNGTIGETTDNIDMAPEIYISRAPISTEAHINAFVNKVLEYETNPTSTSYVKTILLTGTDLFGDYNSAGESDAHWKNEDMYSNYISPQWSGIKTKFYDTGTDFTGGASYDLTASNLQSTLNNGYHFVHMATHGGQTSWSMETGSSYNSTNAQNQANSKHSIIVTMACNTNAFDDAKYTSDPCLSEAFLRNPNGGCVLYWGSSRYGWSSSSWHFSGRFFQNFFSGSPSADAYKFGAVTAISKSYYISSSSSYSSAKRWLQFSQNAIGDPELLIFTENPLEFTSASVTQSGTTVTVNTGGVSDCNIALTSMDFGTTYYDVKEGVSSTSFTNVDCPYYVTITKHNYKPYQYPTDVYIQNYTFNYDAYISGRNIYVGNNVIPSATQGDVIIKNGVNVIFDAFQNMNFDSGFEAELGGTFEVK